MRRFLLLSIVLLLAPQKQTTNEQKTQKQVPAKQVQPSEVAQNIPDSSQPPIVKFNTYNTQQKNDPETAKVIFDGLLVVANIGLVFVGLRQAKILGNHEEWMQKHDAKLDQLAKAAIKSADVAEKTLKLTQAAVIGIECYIAPTGAINIQLKNYGRSAARNIWIIGTIEDGTTTTSYRVGPQIAAPDAMPKAVLGHVRVKQDNLGHPHAFNDVRCAVNVMYEDIFDDSHTRSYMLVFDKRTLQYRVEQETG